MRALTTWRPTRQLSTLHNEIDDLFARFFGDVDQWWLRPPDTSIVPAIESFMRKGDLVVRVDLPGIDPKNVELAIEGDQLTIKGERKSESESSRGEDLCREVSYGRFERSITLPAGVDPESVKATYHDGVLEVTMKAPQGLVSRKVPIAVH